jgi:hypothetical protein
MGELIMMSNPATKRSVSEFLFWCPNHVCWVIS